jgi:polyhydroxybutyrate depolymerase
MKIKKALQINWSKQVSNLMYKDSSESRFLSKDYISSRNSSSKIFKIFAFSIPLCCILCCCLLIGVLFFSLLFLIIGTRENDQNREIIVDGNKRYYILHFPKNYNSSQKLPLVVGLHGGFGNARQFKNQNGWDQVSDDNNFIMLYPYGYASSGRLFLLAWNSGTIVSESYNNNISDVNFIKYLVEDVISNYNIDKNRVSCTGHSNGAFMCYRMAGDVPNLFQTIAPVSGACGGYVNQNSPKFIIKTPTNSIKLVHVHGLQDVNVKVDGGVGEGPGGNGRIDLGINETLSIFTKSNQCSTNYESEFSQNNLIELRKYKNCLSNQKNIQLYFLKNRAHMWDDMNQDARREQFKGNDLASSIWRLMNE